MRRAAFVLALVVTGCAASPAAGDGGVADAGNNQPEDAGNNNTPADAGNLGDAGPKVDAGMFADAGACYAACITNNPAAYKIFQGDELSQCGCQPNATCASECTAQCQTMTVPTATSACGVCIAGQEDLNSGSGCINAAGTACFFDSSCTAFASCGQACP